ncbi:MAG: ATP-binding protein [Gammaproteobacteria bacterium]|nr:MAG: ATP-binding protein [Gammaproteobacteria bacterium]
MPRRLIRKYLPSPASIKNNRSLNVLGSRIHDPNLWHLNRRSVSGAVFVGLFVAFMPIPFQMVLAAVLAVAFNVNLPLSTCLVWISNPLTYWPIFYFAYKLGTLVLGLPDGEFNFELSWRWLKEDFGGFWQPLLTGSLISGLFFGLAGFSLMRLYWRLMVTKRWQQRHKKKTKNPR